MKFKSKRHLILTLKKKSGVELSIEEAKELMGLEPKKEEEVKKPAEAKAEDKPKEEEKKPEEKVCDDKPKEEEKKEAPAGGEAISMESLGAAIASLQENMNMLMEALATMMEGSSNAAPAEEAKTEDKPAEAAKEEEVESEEEEKEMSEDEMEKELEKTIAELESIA
jgi:hypothetical protein